MSKVFFGILGVFASIAALLSLVAVIILVAYGFRTLTHKEPAPVVVAAHPTVDQYLSPPADAAASTPGGAGTAADPKDNTAKTGPLFKRIITAINTYATAVGDEGVDEDTFQTKRREKTESLTAEQYFTYLEGLATQCEKLPALAEKVKASRDTEHPIELNWLEFVHWYDDAYMAPYEAQGANGLGAAMEEAGNKSLGYAMLGGAAGAFTLFISFTMILLMVRIESNTRRVA